MFRKFCFYFSEITFKDSTCKANANIQNESKKEKRKKKKEKKEKKRKKGSFLPLLPFLFPVCLFFIFVYISFVLIFVQVLFLHSFFLFFLQSICFSLTLSFQLCSVFCFIKFFLPDSCGNQIRFRFKSKDKKFMLNEHSAWDTYRCTYVSEVRLGQFSFSKPKFPQ